MALTFLVGCENAASTWDALPERKRIRESILTSYERLFHDVGVRDLYLPIRGSADVADALREPRLESGIGVSHWPETEPASHYFEARLSDQFDVVFRYRPHAGGRASRADGGMGHRRGPPETYPSRL
jgi:erythromycin esterase-like protein